MKLNVFLADLGILAYEAFGYFNIAKDLISTQKVDTTGKFYHTCQSIEKVVVMREPDFKKLVDMASKAPGGPGKIEF